jgi:DNA-binding beta-propeller fold protein YncE
VKCLRDIAWRLLPVLGAGLLPAAAAKAADADEFRSKREAVFEFTEKPSVTRQGDKVTIRFASKGWCDVTVAIENADGRIIRHLASGVLGPKAPPPFRRDALKQAVVWDGKDDRDVYVDDKDSLTVRVSLGLKPQFEKNLFWSPYKRISQAAPLMAAAESGVVVSEGSGVDSVRMYDHDGKFLKTVYPFPAAKLAEVQGLDWRDFPQGLRYPWKQSLYQQTLLTSGDNCNYDDQLGRHGRAATGIALRGRDLVLASIKMNRLTTEGTSGGRDLLGGRSSFPIKRLATMLGPVDIDASPSSVAFSPDGKWVYLTGFAYRFPYNFDTMHGVARMPLDGREDAKVFAGKVEISGGYASGAGSGPGEFRNATSVDCDGQGRVYVGDFMNDRVQVFDPEGKFLKEIKAFKPAVVKVNRTSGEIWVFSWMVPSRFWSGANPPIEVTSELIRFKSFEDPKEISRQEMPIGGVKVKANGKYGTYVGLSHPLWFTAEVDFWTSPPTVWVGRECRNDIESGVAPGNGGQITPWQTAGIRLMREKDGKWEFFRDFGAETVKQVVRAKPPYNAIQRLEVNPVTGKLYVGEADSGPTGKASTQLVEIDPATEKIKIIELPFNPMEFVFDPDGLIYLRNTDNIVRYDFNTFREVPFDYGEERRAVGRDGGIGGRDAPAIAALPLPSKSPVCYHQGGINVNAKGRIIASCAYRFVGISGTDDMGRYKVNKAPADGGKAYEPRIYPGRISNSTTPCIHVWDKHGKLLYEDAVPGVAQVDGVGIDRDDNVYFMHTPSRMLDGKPYFNEMSETLTKVRPGKCKVISKNPGAPVPLPEGEAPKRKLDLYAGGVGQGWVDGAEWMYGGVGYAGFNSSHAGGGCACWFSRWALDYFARSVVPEPQLFGVAVLDSAGNLITRIGRYGNADDGKPLVTHPEMKSPAPLGGDEIGLFYACYTSTHTDRRIFISDVGNGRILSVKLGYHTEERMALKDVPDQGRPR